MDPLDAMAMEEMMGGPMDAGMGAEDEMVSIMVPAWTVPAVEELVSILQEDGAGGMMPDVEGAGMEGELAF